MQLVALEERVLYSAGPIPGEVVDVDLLSQGDFQGIDSGDLGINSIELAATDTLEFLQQQIDDANALDSIEAIESLELVPSDLGDGDLLNADVSDILAGQFANDAIQFDDAAVSSDLQTTERVTAAVSVGLDLESGVSISGRILHDVDGDGDVVDGEVVVDGGNVVDDGKLGLEGVTVRLYIDGTSGTLGAGDLVNGFFTTETDHNGFYEFSDLTLGDNYFVAVSSTTLSQHFAINNLINTDLGFTESNIWGVQTYAAEGAVFDRGAGQQTTEEAGAFYGGFHADRSDGDGDFLDPANLEHLIFRESANEDQTNVDFGFSFNVVTNTLGGDSQSDDPASGRSVQGSLRQFISNANAIVGDNELRFVPITDPSSTSANGDFYEIEVSNQLGPIQDEGTVINGSVYRTDGSPVNQTPEEFVNANALPTGSSVDGVDDSLLGPSFRPSLTLSGDNVGAGLVIQASRTEVSNLAVVNFFDGIIVQNADVADVTIHDNFIGAHADGKPSVEIPKHRC